MSNVAEFIDVRVRIESLAAQVAILTERKTMPQSKNRLDEAAELLVKLTAMADNDVQDSAVTRLTRLLARLETKVVAITPKVRVSKKAAAAAAAPQKAAE
jgi:hypothetical protein